MGKITGIFNESLGGVFTIRGYAMYDELIRLSYPHEAYQRPVDQVHVDDIQAFIESGRNSFSPEIILSYIMRYDYKKDGNAPTIDPITDINNGIGFKSNVDNLRFKIGRKLENGQICEITTPNKTYEKKEDKPFRRVDGNHRLQAIEKLIESGHSLGRYIVPFCLVLLSDDGSIKDEKIIFHNINSKAIPLNSEQLIKGIINKTGGLTDFSDVELERDFGYQYLLARKVVESKPLIMAKLSKVNWILNQEKSLIVELINYVAEKTDEQLCEVEREEAFGYALNKALEQGKQNDNVISISSGTLFALTYFYYSHEILDGVEKENIADKINNFIAWKNKYNLSSIGDMNIDNAATNSNSMIEIFDKYMQSSKYNIFLSRCFDCNFDETERAIRRVIATINAEKSINIMLHRVDKHQEGVSGDIFHRIEKGILECGLLIADITGGKPNVHHEIGMAMGMGKDFIIVHHGSHEDAEKNTPSNIKMYEQVRFSNNNYSLLESEIKNKIEDFYKL